MDDPFAGIAGDYDKMFPRDLAEDGRLLAQLFDGRQVRRVLDCACGTGLHVAMLARQGYEVTGTDVSDAMLELAEARLSAEGLAARLVKARWSGLPGALEECFDAVICIGNSLPLAGDDSEVEAAIGGMYDVLAPGGVLVIQNRNMDKMLREKPPAILNPAERGFVLFVFEYAKRSVIYKIFYLVTSGDAEGRATYSKFHMNLLTRSRFERMLKRAGASSWRLYGDSYLSVFSATRSPRLIAAVSKQ